MVRPRPQIDRRLFVSAAALFGASAVLGTVPAWADDEDAGEGEDPDAEKENPDEPDAEEKLAQADAVYQRVTSLQNELAEAAQAYYQALDEHEAAVSAVDDAQRRIDEASTQIDTLQDRLAKRAVGMYKAGKFTVIDLLMGSASFKEFATGLDMYDALNENDERMIEETKALRDQVATDKEQLELQEQVAKEAADEAERVKNEAQEKVAAMQAILQQLDEEAKAALESMQDRDRAEAAQASSAQVRRAYAYNIPSVPIPANGSVVDYALSRIGCPYVWGAEGPETFDCSGLVRWAYLQVGTMRPRRSCPWRTRSLATCCGSATATATTATWPLPATRAARITCTPPRSAPLCATPTRCPGRASPTHCASRKGADACGWRRGRMLAGRAVFREGVRCVR